MQGVENFPFPVCAQLEEMLCGGNLLVFLVLFHQRPLIKMNLNFNPHPIRRLLTQSQILF